MKQNSFKKGFTIAELILVIAIIGVLFGIGMGTYREQRERFTFNDSLSRIIGLIQTARQYAITSRAAFIGGELFIPPAGYGVRLVRTASPGGSTVTLFANTGDLPDQYEDGVDLVEETYSLPEMTNFEKLHKNNKETDLVVSEAVIIFRPPLAETTITSPLDSDINTLFLRLSLRDAPAGAPDQFISINRTSGFPELEL